MRPSAMIPHLSRILYDLYAVDKTNGSQYIMRNGQFEWWDEKAASNWRDHGDTFDQAAKAAGDHFAIEAIDDREDYGEERINLIGMCEGVLLHVT